MATGEKRKWFGTWSSSDANVLGRSTTDVFIIVPLTPHTGSSGRSGQPNFNLNQETEKISFWPKESSLKRDKEICFHFSFYVEYFKYFLCLICRPFECSSLMVLGFWLSANFSCWLKQAFKQKGKYNIVCATHFQLTSLCSIKHECLPVGTHLCVFLFMIGCCMCVFAFCLIVGELLCVFLFMIVCACF